MGQIQKFRHNAVGITAISGFENIRGGINGCCKDVYFVRALGVNPSYLDEIKEMDAVLSGQMGSGRVYYRRLDGLPRLQAAEDISFYADSYSGWEETGKKRVVTRVAQGSGIWGELLGNACAAVERIGKQGEMRMSDSMCKNMMVKMLFWFDSVFGQDKPEWDERKVWKIAADNIRKRQEYLFFYLLTLTGCDVLLLQSKGDIDETEERLGLSAKFVLGDYSETAIPKYVREVCGGEGAGIRQGQGDGSNGIESDAGRNGGSQERQGGCIRVKIPEHRPRKRHAYAGRPAAGGEVSQEAETMAEAGNRPGMVGNQPGAAGNRSRTGGNRPGLGGSRSGMEGIMPVTGGNRSGMEGIMPGVADNRPGTAGNRTGTAGNHPGTGNGSRVYGGSHAAAGQEAEKSFEELAMLASSVVMITIHGNKGDVIGTGSGIMVGRQGYILTNNHVASGGKYYSVRIEDDDRVYTTDEVIKYNYVLDLAVIRIDRKLIPIPVYKGQKKLVRGQKVVAIGSPLGLFNSVSDGIISGFRKIDNVDMIQFTAPTSHGSSGGAVLNMQGEVIGISTAGFDGGQNINLAMGYECINLFIKGFT